MANLIPIELPTFIPFTSDYGFKVTFGNEENTVFLRRAIPALTQSVHPIAQIFFDKTVYSGLTISGKSGIFDLACTDETGSNYLIEMEVRAKTDFLQRLKFYAILRFNTFIEKGKRRYDKLPRQYCIAFLKRNIYPLAHYHNSLSFRNQEGIKVDNQMTLVTIELPKFKVAEKDVKTDLEKLVFTIKNAEKMVKLPKNKRPLFMQEEWLDSALNELDVRNFSPQKYEAYMRYMMREAEARREKEEEAAKNKRKGKIEEKTEIITELLLQQVLPVDMIAKATKADVALVERIKSKLNL